MSEALFRSAHQALLFAYTFSDTEHGTAAAAERQIALAARERYERTASSGRGLKGVDGAAQAGMIRSIVDCNTRPAFGVLCVARFALPQPSSTRASEQPVFTFRHPTAQPGSECARARARVTCRLLIG